MENTLQISMTKEDLIGKGETPDNQLIMQGTCQICERTIKSKFGIIAHHGFQRPGDGWQTNSCMGARGLPYEKSRDIIPNAIGYLKLQIENIKNNIKRIEEENLPVSRFKGESVPSTHLQYISIRENYFDMQRSQIRAIEMEIERLQKRFDEWKGVKD